MYRYLINIGLSVAFSLAGLSSAFALGEFVIDRPGFVRAALSANLNWRCNKTYAWSGTRFARAKTCFQGVQIFLDSMDAVSVCRDIDGEKKFCSMVVFKNDLKKSLTDPITNALLENIEAQIVQLNANPSFRLNVWKSALGFWSDENIVRQKLAILLQDTSSTQMHIRWLQNQNLNSSEKSGFELLRSVTDRLYSAFQRADQFKRVQIMPFEGPNSDQGSYHYFVISELRRRTEAAGAAPRMARFLPFVFNYIYEIQLKAKNKILSTIIEPDFRMGQHTVGDLYMAYRGVTWQLPGYQPVSFARFSAVAKADRTGLLRMASY